MSEPIDFYFDFTSPYGYLASTRIDDLAARYGRTVRWHPMLLGVVFKMNGCAPLSEVPLKGAYSLHDFVRTARFHGIPYHHPEKFPLAMQLASRAMLWLQETQGERKAVEFAHAALKAYFVDGEDITQVDIVAAISERLGVDGDLLIEEANTPTIKDKLRAEIATAMERGVFGSPFVIVDDEPFWGFDRFYQVEALLKNGKL